MKTVYILSSLHDHLLPGVLLYVGPDLILPLTSALAAIAGAILLFWNKVLKLVRSAWRVLFVRQKTPRG